MGGLRVCTPHAPLPSPGGTLLLGPDHCAPLVFLPTVLFCSHCPVQSPQGSPLSHLGAHEAPLGGQASPRHRGALRGRPGPSGALTVKHFVNSYVCMNCRARESLAAELGERERGADQPQGRSWALQRLSPEITGKSLPCLSLLTWEWGSQVPASAPAGSSRG